jgi:beta-xylosidase
VPGAEKQQLKHADRAAQQPNQGGLVAGPDGRWYFYTHHGDGTWAGRVDSLLPVTWRAGWPIIGVVGADGIGSMVWSGRMPGAGSPVVTPQSSDEFATAELGPQWEWNYQPRAAEWSLTERPGWLRLHAFRPLAPDDLLKAGNTLTQRVFRAATNEVLVKLDLGGLVDGQSAGLCHFSKTWSTFGVRQTGAVRTLVEVDRGQVERGPGLTGNLLWLRSAWGPDGLSRYSYSLDGQTFTDFGTPYQLGWGYYRGDRVGIYSYNSQADAGYLDVDYFHYDYAGMAN